MIEVDVIGQLLPNPITMITQLCSTLVLFLVIRKFLWASVKRFLDQRADKMQQQLTQSETDLQRAAQDRRQAENELRLAREQSSLILQKAAEEARDTRETLLRQAHQEAEDQLTRARGQMEMERQRMQSEMRREMVEIALSATEKLIADKADAQDDRRAIEQLIEEAGAYGQSCR